MFHFIFSRLVSYRTPFSALNESIPTTIKNVACAGLATD
jgi:hypothetical protein